ncbi:MAG: glycosyltransferase [Desulfobacteraceae bacterium]|jgi:cellulose synthase/poly-beta-1,6-N-acetylglucosamine synthase-like glycosyltransferase|nr:glycosyltransferase [Desulfobacteraceae bacterium]
MQTTILNILTIIHFLAMAGLTVYGVHRIWMIRCRHNCSVVPPDTLGFSIITMPTVTVQIPLYNEPRVAARIIDAVAVFAWPDDKLEIQVLDDSDDDTRTITEERAAYWAATGKNIRVIRRNCRTGYKAGALAAGLKKASGDFIAVFDADFVPAPDFLKNTLPYFTEKNIGMVQARWGFLNTNYSWLTRLQALLLSAHFGIEHEVRCRRGLFFNFNGTAGVWRKTAIESAGGWESDTVTEDLDLSYRAQLYGWRFVYLHHVAVPSELPVTLADFRCQQERWSKGAIQTAKKLLPRIMSASLPLSVKIEASAHLLANSSWVFGFLATLTLYPALINRIGIGVYQVLWIDLPLFLFTGGTVLLFYLMHGLSSGLKTSLIALPLLPAASIGLAPFFSIAVLKGMFQKGGLFVRTPKSGVLENSTKRAVVITEGGNACMYLLTNLTLFVYMLMPVFFSLGRGTWPALPFLCLFPAGFLLMVACDLKESLAGAYGR